MRSLENIKGFEVAADNTYLGEIITSAGLTNISPQKKGYGEISLESFLTKKVHFLIFFSRDKDLDASEISKQLKKQFKITKLPKVLIFKEDYTLIPGPGTLSLMKEVDRVLQ